MQTPILGRRVLVAGGAGFSHQDCRPSTQLVPVILINLDRSVDRLARMRAEFDRAGLVFERFPALNGTDSPPSVRPYFCDAAGKIVCRLGAGEIGCYASHLAIWQRIAEGRYGSAALVCEDDIALPDDIAALLDKVLCVAPSGWDIVRLSNATNRPVAPIAPLGPGRTLIRYWRTPLLSGAYLMSRTGATKLLRPGIRYQPVDQDLARPWLFDLDAYGVCPAPISQDAADSVIDGMGGREHRAMHRTRLSRSAEHASRLAYNLKTMGLRGWLGCSAANRSLRLGLRSPQSACSRRDADA
jgi:glycosyl transferase family 25